MRATPTTVLEPPAGGVLVAPGTVEPGVLVVGGTIVAGAVGVVGVAVLGATVPGCAPAGGVTVAAGGVVLADAGVVPVGVVPWIRAEAGIEIPSSLWLVVPAAEVSAARIPASAVSAHAMRTHARARAWGMQIRAIIALSMLRTQTLRRDAGTGRRGSPERPRAQRAIPIIHKPCLPIASAQAPR